MGRDVECSLVRLGLLGLVNMERKPQEAQSSSPGEFHPQALTEPCVNLSIHTALPMRTAFRLLPSVFVASSPLGLGDQHLRHRPDPSLLSHYRRFITTTIWSARVECLGTQWLTGTACLPRSLLITPTRSHVPYKGPSRILATCMPEAGWPVSRSPPTLSRDRETTPVLTIF